MFDATRRAVVVSAALFAALGVLKAPVQATEGGNVKAAMQALKDETSKLGPASLDGEALNFGPKSINGDFSIVDEIKAKHGGTATLFAKKGNNFVRISTNVMKDGARATGTILDPSGPAYAAVSQDKPYYGMVDILGKIYDTGYEPIRGAGGAVIGVYYVGYAME